jgi:hypothetical protein
MKKRSNTHPCTSKALHTIGIYGGKEEFSHIIGIISKINFFKDSRASRKNICFQNSPYYNKKAAYMNLRINGKLSPPEYLDYLMIN